MNRFWSCFWYLSVVSLSAFFVGRCLPKGWFKADRFPYRCFPFEENGRLYDRLHIRKWQNKLPDMSKILPKWIPAKNLKGDYMDRLPTMVRETCVAEFIHLLLCILSLHCLCLYPGVGGIVITGIYTVVLNVPYILIQRYNRPKLIRLAKRKCDSTQKNGSSQIRAYGDSVANATER